MDNPSQNEVKLYELFDKFIQGCLSRDRGYIAMLFRGDKQKKEDEKWRQKKLNYQVF